MATPEQATRRAVEPARVTISLQPMTGAELRALRLERKLSQKTFAGLLGMHQGRVNAIEKQKTVPPVVAAVARTLSRMKSSAELKALVSPRLVPWRDSSKFSQKPPFESLPANGACPCGGFNCRLSPELDGDWRNGHLWKFHGSKCHRHVFLNSAGVRVAAVHQPRWRESLAFKKKKPPFTTLPSPCPICGKAECKPKPVPPVRERDGQYLWVFQGGDCYKSYCLNAQGVHVGEPPRRNVVRRPIELREPCSQCGRLRVMGKMFRSRLGCDVITLYCRATNEDLASRRKHDPCESFREENGTWRPLTVEELDLLHDRNGCGFPSPHCEDENCSGHGQRMERSGLRQGEIAAFVCRLSKRRHYAFRHVPAGETVSKLADGWYQWRDAQTGQVREIKRPIGGPLPRGTRRHPPAPVVTCPDHPDNHLDKISGPWPDKKTRKLRWQYNRCAADPSDHPGWTCSNGEVPRRVVARPKRRWQGQRRALSQAKVAEEKRKYETLKEEFKSLHDFVRSINARGVLIREKLRLIEQYRLGRPWKLLGHYWQQLTTDLGEALAYPKAWTPAEKAKELLAPGTGYTVATYSRLIVESNTSRM